MLLQAFIAWFSIAPLMPVIRDSLNLSTREVRTRENLLSCL
jgi:nitrate/nitrite transporter NarK